MHGCILDMMLLLITIVCVWLPMIYVWSTRHQVTQSTLIQLHNRTSILPGLVRLE